MQGAYDLVLNNYGPETWNGSIHIEVPDTYSAARLDQLIREITMKVYREHQVILTAIGVYSMNTKDEEVIEAKQKVEEIVHPDRGGDAGNSKDIPDDRHCHDVCRVSAACLRLGLISPQVRGGIDEGLIDRVHMDIAGRRIVQDDRIDQSGDPFIFRHPRHRNLIPDLNVVFPLILPDRLFRFEQTGAGGYSDCLERRRDRKADRLSFFSVEMNP